MTFDENPFRVLNVSIYDDKATIIKRADDLSFAAPDNEELIERARDTLLNPRKRIAAEMRYFDEVDIKNLFALAGLNRLIHSLSDLDAADKLEAVVEIDALYSELSVEDVRDQINAARAKSKFPAVQDVAAIRDELKNIRDDVRGIVQNTLKTMAPVKCAEFANDFADMLIDDDEDFGIIAEDFFDSYRLEMSPFLDDTRTKFCRYCRR